MLLKSFSTSRLPRRATTSFIAYDQKGGYTNTFRSDHQGKSNLVTMTWQHATSSGDGAKSLSCETVIRVQVPADDEKRHIRFNERVEQFVAVDVGEDESVWNQKWSADSGDDSEPSDDGIVMKAHSRNRRRWRSNSTSSLQGQRRGVRKLPPTKLKFRTDETPDRPPSTVGAHFLADHLLNILTKAQWAYNKMMS